MRVRIVLLGALTVTLLIWAAVLWAGGTYDRRAWLPDWADADHNCRDTRTEVLMREQAFTASAYSNREQVPLALSPEGCRVVAGTWLDPYTREVFTDPGALDIDHVVPLGYAEAYGGRFWPVEKKRAFANWLGYRRALRAVSASANRQKGARGPGAWVPRKEAWCEYAESFAATAWAWGLSGSVKDREAVKVMLETC